MTRARRGVVALCGLACAVACTQVTSPPVHAPPDAGTAREASPVRVEPEGVIAPEPLPVLAPAAERPQPAAASAPVQAPEQTPCNAFADREVCAVSLPQGDGTARVSLRNTTRAAVTAYLTPEGASAPLIVVIPAGATVPVTTLPQEQWRAHLHALWGTIDAALTDDVVELPWDRGDAHGLLQGPDGAFSHGGEQAWDFGMETGTRVRAARGGVVAFAADSSKIGGGTKAFREDGNMTIVVHDDGTVALYAHLRFAGAWKNVGERVDAGELLAISGNTGFSAGPHLHFQVMRPNRGGAYETLPVRFRTADGVRALTELGPVLR